MSDAKILTPVEIDAMEETLRLPHRGHGLLWAEQRALFATVRAAWRERDRLRSLYEDEQRVTHQALLDGVREREVTLAERNVARSERDEKILLAADLTAACARKDELLRRFRWEKDVNEEVGKR